MSYSFHGHYMHSLESNKHNTVPQNEHKEDKPRAGEPKWYLTSGDLPVYIF